MIIFYEKATGTIIGTIADRIHPKEHLKMWVGDKTKTNRIVVNWKPIRWYTKEGHELPKECLNACDKDGNLFIYTADFEPDHPQKELLEKLDKKPGDIYKHKINLKTKRLVKK